MCSFEFPTVPLRAIRKPKQKAAQIMENLEVMEKYHNMIEIGLREYVL